MAGPGGSSENHLGTEEGKRGRERERKGGGGEEPLNIIMPTLAYGCSEQGCDEGTEMISEAGGRWRGEGGGGRKSCCRLCEFI